ncbi:MAG: hypothetical protein ABW157_19825 [Candidatus Thiodiazotropha sp. LLP2]|nr:hypothetical protein [Candidatus Thiodiazotropha lotti]MCG8010491.1 hypothetical protein [Candidatus Thiodiazotropha lotti]MCW4209951.1 hypothetical protein [Candidatus Thiodiazotropha lotti]MCW4216731.1 hypothetical protein [Candidatus Thiodiazotropha lotti]
MAIYEITEDGLDKIPETDFSSEGIKEREDLQRLLREQVEVISPNTLVVSEEFGEWEDSRRRVDLLAIDKDANLVVIELKRTEDGGHMELQAIRYAAMVSTLTFEKVVDIYGRFLSKLGKEIDPATSVLEFLGWDEPLEDEFAQEVKIVLASRSFSKELTTSVIWLNERGLDIRCVRMKPYKDGVRTLLDVQTVIPLPEAEDYQVKIREKQQKERNSRNTSKDLTKYEITIEGSSTPPLSKRKAIFTVVQQLCKKGVSPEDIHKVLHWRANGLWRIVEGEVSSDEFKEEAIRAANNGGFAFDPGRWFCSDDELIFSGNKTFAFTKMWGVRTEEGLRDLLEAFSGNDISFASIDS